MSDFELNSTSGTPGISFKAKTGDFRFTGYSIPQRVNEFYEPILNWLKAYSSSPAKATRLVMAMEYMDNASRKAFDKIFSILRDIEEKGSSKVSIVWFYQNGDDDMLGLGKKLERSTGLSFEFDSL